ncbi:MAG: LuxR family transcriptional regulator [Roseateles asaccharophilus]|uniref:LuxR family transcriptional activator of bioluminescence operon/LuxR family quorum-sensing transcriptional regulator LasR n=1 Tax=Roseateles asaccharophilus TaxID=582607 RepID=A0A4R6NBD7_9BURK|nr:LuxR family transcriptional regulator [Roseateles asaccharophilus]MDN3543373.1 LuxR family transcriptional regulator [Roseateles asaccharophilus]TDP12928.1 LuxR family transcriptional activator of bioluminescence operon/LuxR family quorum-sensing transcriptional regulator LasR [Roseateles asaccharophilus]
MLQGGYQSVLEARTREEFRGEVLRFTKKLEFDTFSAITVVDHALGRSEFIAIDNSPPGFSEALNDPRLGRLDPVMQHCKRNSVPIVWDRDTYRRHDADDLWEAQASYGYRTGICLALHLPEGRHFVLGVDRDRPLPNDNAQLIRLVADLQLFAVHALDAALRVLLPPEQQLEAPKLTPRELECLRWTMEGKTAWEVGGILGIAERTAVLHINNAMRKLKCSNKHQAVLKALRFGLIR